MNLFHEAKKILDKDGKVNPLGPYGKQKLTGREVATYFRRNKITDPQVKKAIEVALDMGGAMDIAGKEIQKFFGKAVRDNKDVKQALRYANESYIAEQGESLEEGKNLIPAFQEIVKTKGAKKIGGIMVDMFTASVITQAYEKVNDKNKANMEKSDVKKLVGLAQRIMGMKEETISEETIVYKVKGMQKPESEKFQSSAKLMKLKVAFKKKGSDTLVTMTGNKKQLRDFDSVARGKSSYGDPSSIQHFDEQLQEGKIKTWKAIVDFDMGDPRDEEVNWEDDGVYIDNWNKRNGLLTLVKMGKDKKAFVKWLTDVYGLDKSDANSVVK